MIRKSAWQNSRALSSGNDNENSFSMDISVASCCPGKRATTVEIYVDDAVVYTSQEIGQKTTPFSIENIDLKNAKYLKIVVKGNGCVILSNAEIE